MRRILEDRNRTLSNNLEELTNALTSATIPRELEPYRDRLLSICGHLLGMVARNMTDLAIGQDLILEDVLSNTQQAMQYVRLLSARMASPIFRASSTDRVSLATINWAHREHPITASIPAAFADGDCSIWPFLHIAPIYFFPSLEQRRLLYQPLYFHEFGHLLYVCHKQEMDDLVGELQHEIEEVLFPASQRNDRHADTQSAQRQAIVDTWYKWTQELFCDAVELTIGGPCFLRAFSGYLGTMERGDFYREPTDLQYSDHPVTWLRVRLLSGRARAEGFTQMAIEVEAEWDTIARAMAIAEDYHGFFDQALEAAVARTIDDMLTEAEPRRCSASEAGGEQSGALVSLLNEAWRVYRNSPGDYATWESEAVRRVLQ